MADREKITGYGCRPGKVELVTLYAGRFRSSLRGAAYPAGSFVINTRGAKKGGEMKVLLFGEARKDPEKALRILENSFAGAGTVPKPELYPVFEEEDPRQIIEDLEEQLGYAQDDVGEAARRVEVAERERDRAYNDNLTTIQGREKLVGESEERKRRAAQLEEERKKFESWWNGATRDNKELREELKGVRGKLDETIEEKNRLQLEQAQQIQDPIELLVSAVRNYAPTMSHLDAYEKELTEALGGQPPSFMVEISKKSEGEYTSERLKDVGVKPDEVPPEPLPDWEQDNFYITNIDIYNRATKNRRIILAGLPPGEELTEDLKQIVTGADKVISEFELNRQTYQRKTSAVSVMKEARETYARARKVAKILEAAPTAEIPILVSGNSTEKIVRVYFPQSNGEFLRLGLFDDVIRMAGDGFEIKTEGDVRVLSRTFAEGDIGEYVAKLAGGFRNLEMPGLLKGGVKVSQIVV